MILDWNNNVGGTDKPTGIDFHGKRLIVLDAEDREQVERLYDLFSDTDHESPVDGMQAALRSLLTPPKPEEPTGLGAVVVDEGGHVWVRVHETYGDFLWRMEVPNTCAAKWADINAVRVLSEGVQP